MIEKHRTKVAVVVIVSASLVGGFYAFQTQDSIADNFTEADQDEDLDKLRIGYVPAPLNSPHYTAIEEGFYEEEGFDAELVQMPGPEIGKSLLNGRVEIGSSATTPAAYQRANDLPLRLVASRAGYTQNGSGGAYLVATEESGINSSEDLKEKTICLSTSGGMGELWLAMWADEQGYEQGEDYEVTFLGDETQYQTALSSGSVDACYLDLSHPDYTMLEKNVGVKKIHEMPRGDWVAAFVGVREEWVDEEPEKLRRFLKAYVKAADYARNNPDERIENTVKYTSFPRETLEETVLPSVPEDLSIDVEDLNQVQSLMAENGMVEEEQEMGDIVHNDAVLEVQQEIRNQQ